MPTAHLAIDLGASSGRGILGLLDGASQELRLEEIHRFEHRPLDSPSGPIWDLTWILRQVEECLRSGAAAARLAGEELMSVGVDTWAVDWVLVDPKGELLGLPHCYRDPANLAAKQRVLDRLEGGGEALFARTGVQLHPFDTLFQIEARNEASPGLFQSETRLLFLPDLLHYWMGGELANERTNASTSAMMSIDRGDWDLSLLESLKLPTGMLAKIVEPGTRLGRIRAELSKNLDLPDRLEIVAPATHDTASAIAAVPAKPEDRDAWAYLSSGTWSLLGMELEEPITTAEALHEGFSNEIGVAKNGKPSVRFLRNIGGLWLLQELRRDLERQGQTVSFEQLVEQAEQAEPFRTLIDPNAADLAEAGDSIKKLRGRAERTGQPTPDTPGRLSRCCLESLALCYDETIQRLEAHTGRSVEKLYAVGGGTQNKMLNRLTAAATNRPLSIGPTEATAVGNLLVQASGLGLVKNLDALRGVVANSFGVEEVSVDRGEGDWESARERYQSISQVPVGADNK